MSPVDAANGALILLAVGLATAAATALPAPGRTVVPSADPEQGPLVDAGGALVPPGPYHRIVSLSIVSDGILAELAEPGTVLAVTPWQDESSQAFRFAGLPRLRGPGDLETLLSLKPDLVLVTADGETHRFARLREAGVQVFDLGGMRGMESLVPQIRRVAALLGVPQRGEDLIRTLETRLALMRASVPVDRRPRALWLSWTHNAIWGGTKGTSYHDVLAGAALDDVAAAAGLTGWPQLSTEQLLVLDPEIIVTDTDTEAVFCRSPLHARLRACGPSGRIVALPNRVISDPGPRLVEAAERLYVEVHGPPRWSTP